MCRAEHVDRDADEVQHDGRHVEHVVGPVAPAGEKSMEVAEDFFGPEIDSAFAGIAMGEFDDGDALGPEEKKKRDDPEPDGDAAVGRDEGTTLRLKTATTKRRTRSRRPRARMRWVAWRVGWWWTSLFDGCKQQVPHRAFARFGMTKHLCTAYVQGRTRASAPPRI